MPSASHIAHAGLLFANPMSAAAVDVAVAAMPVGAGSRLVDTGCGRGEILLRALRAHPGSEGLGVDLDADAIADACRRRDGLPVRFELCDAAAINSRFDAAINVGASHVYGGFPGALHALQALAPVVLYGEGFWQRPPSDAFLAALGGATADELEDRSGLTAAIHRAGFDIIHESVASPDDWAFYEETLAENAVRHGTAETLAYAARIRERRGLPDGTTTLGFGLFVLTRHE